MQTLTDTQEQTADNNTADTNTTNSNCEQIFADCENALKADLANFNPDADTTLCIKFVYSPNDADDSICLTQPCLASNDDDEVGDATRLTDEDRKLFSGLDEELSYLLESLVPIGYNLTIIKGARLYRETHPTFAAYCKDRFGMDHVDQRNAIKKLFMEDLLGKVIQSQVELAKSKNVAPSVDRLTNEMHQNFPCADVESTQQYNNNISSN